MLMLPKTGMQVHAVVRGPLVGPHLALSTLHLPEAACCEMLAPASRSISSIKPPSSHAAIGCWGTADRVNVCLPLAGDYVVLPPVRRVLGKGYFARLSSIHRVLYFVHTARYIPFHRHSDIRHTLSLSLPTAHAQHAISQYTHSLHPHITF